MPNITVVRSHLFESIGKQFTDAEFDELCFEFGVEVDDVSTEIVEVSQLSRGVLPALQLTVKFMISSLQLD